MGDLSPQLEFSWGGISDPHWNAEGSPFPAFSQAVMTPVVANLDDDNGDGLINELDFPEIIFVTYMSGAPRVFKEDAFRRNGVLRAIHGGGTDKGKDLYATCGDTTWYKGEAMSANCTPDEPTLNPTAAIAVGDLDGDGVPEIVAIKEDPSQSSPPKVFGIEIFNNRGVSILRSEDLCTEQSTYAPCISDSSERIYPTAAPAIANLDNRGPSEIIVGRFVFTLAAKQEPDDPKLHFKDGDIKIKNVYEGRHANGSNVFGPISCVADLAPDPDGSEDEKGLEVIAGTSVYRLPKDDNKDKLDRVWDAYQNDPTLFDDSSDRRRRGFCAVADIWGADDTSRPGPDNPLDGKPELINIADGWLQIFEGATGTLIHREEIWPKPKIKDVWKTYRGGAPNVDDFDGDGFPEIGSAFSHAYIVVDLQAPSEDCPVWEYIEGSPFRPNGTEFDPDADTDLPSNGPRLSDCLHNGWKRYTEDDSRATGSSVFDLNGDGAAEVIYNDECYFRIYNGRTGEEIFREPSTSRTRIESPVIADVDNDGNAEIVFTSSNDTGDCNGASLDTNNGLEVWGDANDLWVPARRIWNQHAYHVTNVLEDGRIPEIEPHSWLAYNGHEYNTYRSNPRTLPIAPDLTATNIQISSPDQACGQLTKKAEIVVQVVNQGDLRVGPGVRVEFSAKWDDGEFEALATETIQSSIEPERGLLVSVSYDADEDGDHDRLPDHVRVEVDEGDSERECDEDNNLAEIEVDTGEVLADLRVQAGQFDPEISCALPVTVYNDGSAAASEVVVGFYAGNPEQGGTAYYQEVIAGPIAPGQSVSTSGNDDTAYPANRTIRAFVVVDPGNLIKECNDANNIASASKLSLCPPIE